MPDEWDLNNNEIDSWLDEWDEVDRAAAEYLAQRWPDVAGPVATDDVQRLGMLAETISPSEEPAERDIEAVSAVMALQHADWLGLALGTARRGAGSYLEPEQVQADIEGLDDVDGEIDDSEGHLQVLEMALLHLTPRWQNLGVLDHDERITPWGAMGLPRALYRTWIAAE